MSHIMTLDYYNDNWIILLPIYFMLKKYLQQQL